jgi:hypothetical protein
LKELRQSKSHQWQRVRQALHMPNPVKSDPVSGRSRTLDPVIPDPLVGAQRRSIFLIT